jgi:glycosyltransferase involved in cell wall biosynthesis
MKKTKNKETKLFLSIIIVNYNSGKKLIRTLSSLKQYAKSSSVEIIVIDGGSNDQSYEDARKQRYLISYYISEKDNGIYDAMNKGLNNSNGEWVWFINSGDVPIQQCEYIINKIKTASQKNKNLIYSDILIKKYYLKQYLSIKYLCLKTLNHQNILYKKILLEKKYDVEFKYCADYYHLLCNFEKLDALKTELPLCAYDLEGVTSEINRKKRFAIWRERIKSQYKSSLSIKIKIIFIAIGLIVIVLKLINPSFGSVTHKMNSK